MKLLDKLKKWFTGGSSGSKKSGGSKKSTATEKIKSANRVANYSGGGAQFETYGGGTARKAYQNAERSREKQRKEKEKKKKEQQKLKQIETAFKAQPSRQKTEAQKKEKEKKSSTTSSVSKAFKATPPKAKAADPKIQANAARKESSDIKKAIEKGQRESMAITLQPKVDKKYFSGTKEAKLRLKQGEYMNDPEVSKLEMAKHPVATSLARGGISGATFGLSELAAAKLPKSKGMQEAEDYYQRHKNKGAELAGELGTSLASFGLTSGASKAALGKLAPRTVEKLGASATERVAASGLVREAARKEALKKFGMTATEEQIKNLARSRASNIVKAVGEDMAVNLTTGAVSDVSHALVDSDNPAEFVKNFLMNAGMNLGIGGVATVAPGLIRSTGIDDAVADAGRAAARKLDDVSGKVDLGGEKDDIFKAMDDIANGTEPKASAAGTETDDLLKEMDNIANGKAPKAKAKNALKDEGKRLRGSDSYMKPDDIKSVKEKAKAKPEPKVKTEPKTELVAKEQKAKTENAGAGEKTKFKRGEEKTAKEEARTKRAQKNQKKATKETFDKDFAAFRKKVSENQAKASELREKIRAASTKEEKAALKEQLDALNSEIKREYNKASMRYHPDRGGSNEWMGKFNGAYDDYKKGAYQSRGFSGASSSTRTKTETGTGFNERYRKAAAAGGGGGNTPPPKKGAAAGGEKGFKKPKGKARRGEPTRTVYKVQDVVNKRPVPPTTQEKLVKAGGDVRMSVVDSHAPYEDLARQYRKSDPKKMQNLYGVTDDHRRAGGFATRSIGNKQLNYNRRKFSGTIKRNGFDIENGKSLKDIFKDMDEATETDFNTYLLLKHAPGRAREGKPVFGMKDVNGNNFADDPKVWKAEADKLVNEHPEFLKKAEEVYQYLENERQNLVDAGIISQKTADEWAQKYPNYVPTHRMGETASGMANSINGSAVGATGPKAAKGSDADIRSIRDQLEEMTRRNWEDITLNDMLDGFFGDKAVKVSGELEGGFDLALENNISVAKSLDGKKFYAIIHKGGDKYRVEIDKKYVDALKDWGKNGKFERPSANALNEAVGKYTRVWKNLITEWSPVFMAKNPMRDIPEAFINSRQSALFAKNMPKAFKDIKNGGPWSETLKDMGISQSSFFDLEKSIADDLKAARRSAPGKAAHAVLDKIEAGNQFMEMWPRLSEFMATIEKAAKEEGKTAEEMLATADRTLLSRAAANAADVTVNFGRSGSFGKALNKGFVPFFNPSVQGWSKFARNLTEQPGAKAYLTLAARMGALGGGVTVFNNYMLKDNPNYQQISARDKANNIIFAWPPGEANTTDTFIRIPQSRFASVLSLPAVNAFNENKMGWADAIKVANDQVAPINPIESHFLAPFVAAAKNESWYGTPIVPKALEDLPKSEQTDVNTSAIGTALGKATEKLPRKMQISPKKADYIIDAETGIIGDMVLPATTPSRQGGGKGLKKYGPAILGAATKPFTIDSTVQNDLSTRFYDKLNDANTSNQSKHGGEKDAAEYKRLNSYSSEISGINDAIKYLQGSGRATKQEDIRNLQKVRNSLMQDALDGKGAPSKTKTMDAVQKNVGTTSAVENFGSSADKEAMKVYGAAKYGELSAGKMQKKIDSDKDFYKGVQSIHKLDDSIKKAGLNGSSTTLGKAVALASVGSSDEMFDAYGTSVAGRTETASKAERAKTYFKDGGSMKEYLKLEKNRKLVGKMPKDTSAKELDKLDRQYARKEISYEEYKKKKDAIEYNGNTSYVGHAVSLALANSPKRGYKIYDIKDKNIQKGMNLAAMGITARDYRQMTKDLDTNGNGYPSKQEIIDYVSKSDVKDKATLYDALYYYQGKYNPFGTPTNYSRKKAALVGKEKKVEWIVKDLEDIEVNPEESSGSGYRRYGRRWRRWRRRGYGGGGGGSSATPKLKQSAFKAKAPTPKKGPTSKVKVTAPKTKKLNIKTVKGAKTQNMESMLDAALRDIQSTQKKVAPPKAKRK